MIQADLRMVEAIQQAVRLLTIAAPTAIFSRPDCPSEYPHSLCWCSNIRSFDGSSPTDIDFAAGDDIIDGGDVSSAGFLAEGSKGQANDTMTYRWHF